MSEPTSVSWILMLVLILLVFGAIAAIIWRSWIVGTIVLVLVLVIGALYTVRSSVSPAPSVWITGEKPKPAIELWEPTAEELQTADVFPSLEDAATSLAQQLCKEVSDGKLGQAPVTHIHIVTTDKDGIGSSIDSVFRQSNTGAEIVVDNVPDTDPRALMITAKVEGADNKSKKLVLSASRNNEHRQADARVTNKLWVNHLDEFQGKNSMQLWMSAWSSLPTKSSESARQQARQDAARKMIPLVRSKFIELSNPNTVDDRWLRDRLERDISRFTKEEFVQRMTLPYSGEVYRVGLLLDVSPHKLDLLQGTLLREQRHSADGIRRFGGGIGGLAVLICLVYLFLNRATRGYFQMNLRLAAFLVLIAGVLLIMLIT
jgi:hypothetical protein